MCNINIINFWRKKLTVKWLKYDKHKDCIIENLANVQILTYLSSNFDLTFIINSIPKLLRQIAQVIRCSIS